LGFIGPLVVLGLLVFRVIVYKPLWHTFVFRFELYENLNFLSSLEVLLQTTDPYLWISDSKWRIFLTYLGTSSRWRDFLPFCKNPQSTSSIFPFFVVLAYFTKLLGFERFASFVVECVWYTPLSLCRQLFYL